MIFPLNYVVHFRPEASFHARTDDIKYITNFAYKNFLDPNLFFHFVIYKYPKDNANK